MEKMKLLSFQAETPALALKKAQEHCGEDALVVNTKLIRQKTAMTPPLYEVVVAIETVAKKETSMQVSAVEPQTRAKALESAPSLSSAAKQMSAQAPVTPPAPAPAPAKKPEPMVPLEAYVKPQEEGEAQSAVASKEAGQSTPQASASVSMINTDELKTIKTEISKLVDNVKLIQNMVWDNNEVMREGLVIPPEFAEIYKVSKDSGMSEEHLYEIMKLTIEHMQPKMRESPVTVKRYFNVLLRKLLPIRHEIKSSNGAKKIIMLIGPTGVGKTTTLAKLAARYAFQQETKHRVGVITLDTYRIGAVEQLMQYAKMMKLPIEAVVDPAEFTASLSSLRSCDIILIDTIGSSHYDKKKIDKIASFIKADSSLSIDISLVLPANTKYEDLKEIYDSFSSELEIDTLIVTKMDETKRYGNMFSLLYQVKKPVSYFSTGQEVPEDLITASSEFFVDCLLEGFKTSHGQQ